jgi:predicted signal transduction protein with EAL and GGDEF domain
MDALAHFVHWVAANDGWLRPAVFLGSGALAALVVFLIARVPALRRAQFRDARAWPLPACLLLAAAVFALFALAGLSHR